MSGRHSFLAVALLALGACSDSTNLPAPEAPALARAARAEGFGADAYRQYGPAVKVGDGVVRSYVVLDEARGGTPLEIGVAMSERSMEGLPAPVATAAGAEHGKQAEHTNMHAYVLELPQKNPTPFQFIQFDWNPAGHEPAGVYDLPHFDFHFYTVPLSVRNSIVPSDPAYAQKAASYPGQAFVPPFYIDAATAAGIPAAAATVPQMGLHWLDVRSPELQMMTGHPEAYAPFTKTFLFGSWAGQIIFAEPMITRAYILAKHDAVDPAVVDEVIPVSTAQRYSPAGHYPSAYRITWDASAREYRIALTQLAWRD